MVMISKETMDDFANMLKYQPPRRVVKVPPYPKKATQVQIGQRGNEILDTARLLLTDLPEQQTLNKLIRVKKLARRLPNKPPKGLNRFINRIGKKIHAKDPFIAMINLVDYVEAVAKKIKI